MAEGAVLSGMVAMAAALSIAGTAIASAIAESSIGSAAIGAITEKQELFGNALILTVIPETIVILGFVVSVLMIFK